MIISGVVVRSLPENIEVVRTRLEVLAGVEVHGANPDGRLVVTVEDSGEQLAADTVMTIQDLPGVISASMIYHQHEDDAKLEETE